MKKMTVIAAMILSTSTFAKEKISLKSGEKEFLSCLTTGISEHSSNRLMMEKLAKLIDQYDHDSDTIQLKGLCQDLVNNADAEQTAEIDQTEVLTKENLISEKAARTFEAVRMPNGHCNIFGTSAHVALVVGLSGGLGVGSCVSSDGTKYAAVELAGGYGLGAGAAIYFTRTRNSPFKTHDKRVGTDDEAGFWFAAGIGTKTNMRHERIKAIGLGVGAGMYEENNMAIKLVRIGKSYKRFKQTILP